MGIKYIASGLAVAAMSFAGVASAVNLNPNGLGQVLIYPYYTVNKSQDTLISIANAGDTGRVMSVALREGYNGRQVLKFALFLSAHDVWTASISQTGDDGGAMLRTSDRSCTNPEFPAAGQPLYSADYDGRSVPPFDVPDSGPQEITRTREGYLEVIATGDVVPNSQLDLTMSHVQTGNPGEGRPACDHDTLANDGSNTGVAPTGSLYGSGTIVNVGQGTFFAYDADALSGFTEVSLSLGSDGHSELGPTLALANLEDPARGVLANVFTRNGQPLNLGYLSYTSGADAVSAVFMSDAIYNEYLTDASLGADTDWIVTFPTKHFYVDPAFHPQAPQPPFEEAFANGESRVSVRVAIYDREEGFATLPADCSGCSATMAALSHEVNVISFQNSLEPVTSGVFGSALTSLFIPPYGKSGAAVIDFVAGDTGHQLSAGTDAQGNEVVLRGLPATGFMSYNIINTQAQPGMLANYGGAFHHRTTMSCVGPAEVCDATNSAAAVPTSAR